MMQAVKPNVLIRSDIQGEKKKRTRFEELYDDSFFDPFVVAMGRGTSLELAKKVGGVLQ